MQKQKEMHKFCLFYFKIYIKKNRLEVSLKFKLVLDIELVWCPNLGPTSHQIYQKKHEHSIGLATHFFFFWKKKESSLTVLIQVYLVLVLLESLMSCDLIAY